MISLLANPNQVRPKRFWGVYTKLKIFNMTNYKKGRFKIVKGHRFFHFVTESNLYEAKIEPYGTMNL